MVIEPTHAAFTEGYGGIPYDPSDTPIIALRVRQCRNEADAMLRRVKVLESARDEALRTAASSPVLYEALSQVFEDIDNFTWAAEWLDAKVKGLFRVEWMLEGMLRQFDAEARKLRAAREARRAAATEEGK